MRQNIVLIVLVLLAQAVFCRAETTQETVLKLNDVPPDGRQLLAFASDLFNRGEYYRAMTEFWRFNGYYPKTSIAAKTDFFTAESFCNAQKWDDAIKYYNRFISSSPGDELAQDAEYRLLLSQIQKGDYARAQELCGKIDAGRVNHKWLPEARYLNVLSLISRREWEKTTAEINNCLNNGDSPYNEKYRTLEKKISGYKEIPSKSPVKAGICSALLPGAGQFYAQKQGDGVMAFLLTGISLAAAANCYVNDAGVGAAVFSVFTISFYTANIYNAMNDANRFNREARDSFYLKIVDLAKEKKVFWMLDMQVSPGNGTLILKYKY